MAGKFSDRADFSVLNKNRNKQMPDQHICKLRNSLINKLHRLEPNIYSQKILAGMFNLANESIRKILNPKKKKPSNKDLEL